MFKRKKEIAELFSISVAKVNVDIAKMRVLDKFKDGVIRPSNRLVLIDPNVYEAYLRYQEKKWQEAL